MVPLIIVLVCGSHWSENYYKKMGKSESDADSRGILQFITAAAIQGKLDDAKEQAERDYEYFLKRWFSESVKECILETAKAAAFNGESSVYIKYTIKDTEQNPDIVARDMAAIIADHFGLSVNVTKVQHISGFISNISLDISW